MGMAVHLHVKLSPVGYVNSAHLHNQTYVLNNATKELLQKVLKPYKDKTKSVRYKEDGNVSVENQLKLIIVLKFAEIHLILDNTNVMMEMLIIH
jgi:hypothetical protein